MLCSIKHFSCSCKVAEYSSRNSSYEQFLLKYLAWYAALGSEAELFPFADVK